MALSGRVCLITGGGGHIALAMAEALAELGATLFLTDRDEAGLERVKEQVQTRFDSEVIPAVLDLENEAERRRIPDLVMSACGRMDVLINNAAFVGDSDLKDWATDFEKQGLESWRAAMEVNLTTAFHLSQLSAPMLRQDRGGSIVNVSSIYGMVGPDLTLYRGTAMGNPAGYAASKGGILQLTRWLATVLAPEIRVNSISPGGVFRDQPASFIERYVERTPLRRMAQEEDFKGAISYLASDLSSYVTGHNLVVDGGWTTW